MDNSSANDYPSDDLTRNLVHRGGPFVTIQDFAANQAKINEAKAHLEVLQARNEAGLRNYALVELQKRIEQGRAAQQVHPDDFVR